VTVLVALTIVAPVSAQNACSAGKKAGARMGDSSRKARAPLVIGDSSMIIATPYLGLGIEANSRGCRQVSAGIKMLAARRAASILPAAAVLALGARDPLSAARCVRSAAGGSSGSSRRATRPPAPR